VLRFAHKTFKNRLQGDFLLCKLPKQPINRGFYAIFQQKRHKSLQVQQAVSMPVVTPSFFSSTVLDFDMLKHRIK
jgi:hypothetical protein